MSHFNMNTKRAPKLSDPAKRDEWLNRHINHRVRAGLIGTSLLKSIAATGETASRMEHFEKNCFQSAAWEGRHAAVRWLIEFVGVQWDEKNSRAKRPPLRNFDVWIEDLDGGKGFDLATEDALELAKIWKGCAQATGHPTADSNHFDISPPRLEWAMSVILPYLDSTIFAKAATKIVRHL